MSESDVHRTDAGDAEASPRSPHGTPGVPTRWGRGHSTYGWLVLQFAIKDFKIRYTHSLLGYAWSVINPLMFFLIYYVVFALFFRINIPNYPAFLLIGIVLWNFFAEGTANGAAILLARANLLTKAVLPREVMVYAALLSAGLTFAINLVVLMIFLLAIGTSPHFSVIAFPFLLVNLVLLTLGAALFLAPLHVRFRDVGYLWGIVIQAGFWFTPIVYQESMIPDRGRWLIWVNPMARIIGDTRRVLIDGSWPDMQALLVTTVMSVAVFVIGFAVFQRLQARLVEHL